MVRRIPVAMIDQITSTSNSAANGIDREVYFFGHDLVIKDDGGQGPGGANDREYRNYRRFIHRKPMSFEHDGETWHIRFPKTTRVNGYLIQERIHAPHAPEAEDCPECDDVKGPNHGEGCAEWDFQMKVDGEIAWRCGLRDMHGSNYCVDRENNTVYVIDMAD